ncbi:RNA-directed DNA polymerase from mobile element jockey [Nymphon striatum]|nr:RNA-directed DNA polymerase from mobile element jockey [Nymphon striatum]
MTKRRTTVQEASKTGRTEERPKLGNNEGACILKEEITAATKSLKNGKACGPDEISAEMLRALGDFGVDRITEICNDIYNTGYLPEDMRKSVFITIPKKAHAVECSDYRTISLMSHVTKLLLRIILKRIKNRIDREISEEQFGFRDQRGTREAIFNMKMIMEKHIDVQSDVYTCFIDYSKAFDKIHHVKLIECLQKVGVYGKDLRIITNLYWDQLIERGVRQGCVLSPSLFNICTEMIFREIEDRQGVHMGGRNITNIRFADDTTLLAKDENTLNDTLQKIKNESLKYGLSMNNTKTKTMVISKKKKEKPKINITIDGNKIEQVRQYTYLGQLLDEDADHEKEIKRRIEISRRAFNNMKGIFVSRKINIKLKLRLVKCYIWSILLYGVETWTISKKMEERLEAYEMWIYRRIGKVSWTERKTNEYVLRMLGIKKQLLNIVKERKLKYYGHIKRHQTVQRTTLEGKVEGKRSRGKQRLKGEDNIKGWTKRSMEECGRLAKDRVGWRVIVANLRNEDGT